MVAGIRCANHATPSIRKTLALTSPTSGDRSVGVARSQTKATELWFEDADRIDLSGASSGALVNTSMNLLVQYGVRNSWR
jgi:hypothetical protein